MTVQRLSRKSQSYQVDGLTHRTGKKATQEFELLFCLLDMYLWVPLLLLSKRHKMGWGILRARQLAMVSLILETFVYKNKWGEGGYPFCG